MSTGDPKRPTIALRILGILHILVGLLLLPMSTVFGLTVAFIPAIGAIWIIVLGVKLWRPGPRIRSQLLWTHIPTLIIAALAIAYGLFALDAARRSAEGGGGLLGAFGLIPIGVGMLLALTSIASLIVAVRLPSATPS